MIGHVGYFFFHIHPILVNVSLLVEDSVRQGVEDGSCFMDVLIVVLSEGAVYLIKVGQPFLNVIKFILVLLLEFLSDLHNVFLQFN